MRLILLLLCLGSFGLSAQKKRIVPVQTFPINAKVLFTLQGTSDRAVLRVKKVDPNPYQLEVGDTILCTFFWSIKPVKDEMADFPGIGSGDEISVHIGVKKSPLNGSNQYTAYHYVNRTRSRSKQTAAEAQ